MDELSAVGAVTDRLKLGTGIALAFVRSPLETACSAIDLDLMSGGRCILGLGSSAVAKRLGRKEACVSLGSLYLACAVLLLAQSRPRTPEKC